jgi:hypothetical protein
MISDAASRMGVDLATYMRSTAIPPTEPPIEQGSACQPRRPPHVQEDEWNVPSFEGRAVGNHYDHDAHEPFEMRLRAMRRAGVGREIINAAITVFESSMTARSISLSVFGRAWADHVTPIAQQLLDEQRRPRPARAQKVWGESAEPVATPDGLVSQGELLAMKGDGENEG